MVCSGTNGYFVVLLIYFMHFSMYPARIFSGKFRCVSVFFLSSSKRRGRKECDYGMALAVSLFDSDGMRERKNCRANQIRWNQNEFVLFILREWRTRGSQTLPLLLFSLRAFPVMRVAYNAGDVYKSCSYLFIYSFTFLLVDVRFSACRRSRPFHLPLTYSWLLTKFLNIINVNTLPFTYKYKHG